MNDKPSSRSTWKSALLFTAIMILASVILIQTDSALADIAPPHQPNGSDLMPGEESTQVRMVSETVIIAVSDLYYDDHLAWDFCEQDIELYQSHYDHSQGRAFVTATFHMMNLGDETENMYVRFPLNTYDGYTSYPEIVDLKVKVDGNPVEVSTTQTQPLGEINVPKKWDNASPSSKKPERTDIMPEKWGEFYVSFPPGEEVIITITYTLEAEAWPGSPIVEFSYIMSTGAGWKDTIGSADIILRFPYQASQRNVILDEKDTAWSIEGNDIRWHYEDLEPTPNNNFNFHICNPYEWRLTVLSETQKLQDNPDDDEAWGRLAKAYKHFSTESNKGYLRLDQGGIELYQLSLEAYQKAIELDPDDALWYVGLGDLFLQKWFWSYESDQDILLFRALEELNSAYTLAPEHPMVVDMTRMMQEILGSRFDLELESAESIFLLLTETPSPPSTAAPSTTPTLSPTAPSFATATDIAVIPTSTDSPEVSRPAAAPLPLFVLIGSAIIILAAGGAAALFLSQYKKSR